jgi:hypothetical protein
MPSRRDLYGLAIKKAIEGLISDIAFDLQSETAERSRARKGRRYAADFPAVLFPWTHEDEP